MKAKLYIRGEKDPIELEDNEAVAAQKLITDSAQSKDTPFSIEGVWSGKKADMKYVRFARPEPSPTTDWKADAMDKAEAEAFYLEIQKFMKLAKERYGQEYHWYALMLEAAGAWRLEDFKTPDGRLAFTEFSRDTLIWTELEHKIRRFEAYQYKLGFAEDAKLKQLDQMAKEHQNEVKD